ncbi:cardiolipin synthase ClsB [Ideonella sp. YS5]|uniref:cardiolipin synthase ClsB n=1 Tax=Ideonella sp. YS5 TaxID=3453714 RepID=UPI003EEDF822
MKPHWWPGNRVQLLENGEEFFPAVFDAIGQAEREVIIETFILFEDKVGLHLREVLIAAARRGVQIDLLIDGFGSPDLSDEFVSGLTSAGVRLRSFDPSLRVMGVRFNVLRRMHRKIVVVDGRVAFVGGINYSADHLMDFGPEAKQDYSIQLQGPVVIEIRRFVRHAIQPAPPPDADKPPRGWRAARRRWQRHEETPTAIEPAGPAEALFVRRDNLHHRNDIERYYRIAIRRARSQVLIANAYFFPGYRLLRDLQRAARRGVDVRLILQGQPDMAIVKTAASTLYDDLLRSGVKIHEYIERPLHGKVAVVDDEWATVGSSNLDPLSLALNLEANVVLRDRDFASDLRQRLEQLIERSCREVPAPAPDHQPRWWPAVRNFFVFHFLRRFPVWAGRLPRHSPALVSVAEATNGR